jgi:hypothetical protein
MGGGVTAAVMLTPHATERIRRAIAESADDGLETGGPLVGFERGDTIVIADAGGPEFCGEQARRMPTSVRRHGRAASERGRPSRLDASARALLALLGGDHRDAGRLRAAPLGRRAAAASRSRLAPSGASRPPADRGDADAGRGHREGSVSYQGVVEFDTPSGYWRMPDILGFQTAATVGANLVLKGVGSAQTFSYLNEAIGAPIVGDYPGSWIGLSGSGAYMSTLDLQAGDGSECGGLTAFTVEFWFRASTLPSATADVALGPDAGGVRQWAFRLASSGVLSFAVRSNDGSTYTASGGAIVANTWYYVAGRLSGGTLTLYVNASSVGTAAFAGTVTTAALTAGSADVRIVGAGSAAVDYHYFDELAAYRYALDTDRLGAHLDAGRNRGFPGLQSSGARRARFSTRLARTPRAESRPGREACSRPSCTARIPSER